MSQVAFLQRESAHDSQGHVTIHKLRMKPLTARDLEELERMLGESRVGRPEDIRRAVDEAHGLGLFVRSLIGLDREAAKDAFTSFLTGKSLTGNQIEFVNLIVDHLTEHGVMEPTKLYESPFTDVTPSGPERLFDATAMDELISALDSVKQHTAA